MGFFRSAAKHWRMVALSALGYMHGGGWLEFIGWRKHKRAVIQEIKAKIEEEGGQVGSVSNVGLFIRNPFPPISFRPLYLRITCNYPGDPGWWYICNTDGETYWVWKSGRGAERLPVLRDAGAKVDNNVIAIPFLASMSGGFALVVAAIWFICVQWAK